MKKISRSKIQTQKIAKDFAKQIVQHSMLHRRAMLIGLSGDLGSGKTTFIQGFIKAFGVKERVISPTFVLMKRFKNLIHFDVYRINKPKEILDLGWKSMIEDKENIILVEWAEKIKKLFTKPYFWIEFTHRKGNQRSIDIRLVK